MKVSLLLLSQTIFISFLYVSEADSSCQNPLLMSNNNPNGIPGLSSPTQAGSNLTYCQALENTQVCCSDATINNLLTYYQNLKDNITAVMKAKDQNISQSRDYLKQIVANVQRMNQDQIDITNTASGSSSSGTNQTYNLQNYDLSIPNGFNSYYNRTDQTDMSNVSASSGSTGLTSDVSQLNNALSTFDSNFQKYQADRQTCFEHFMKGFTKFICMGCSADSSKFYNSNTSQLTFNTDYCQLSESNCYDYFSLSELMSAFENPQPYQQTANATGNMANLFDQFKQTLSSDLSNPSLANTQQLSNLLTQMENIEQTNADNANNTYIVRSVPSDCTSNTSCQYICNNFLSLHGLNTTELMFPGIPSQGSGTQLNTTVSGVVRRLQATSVGVVYSSNGYNVSNVTSGAETQVSFDQNPADVSTTSSSFAVGMMVSRSLMVLMIIAMILI